MMRRLAALALLLCTTPAAGVAAPFLQIVQNLDDLLFIVPPYDAGFSCPGVWVGMRGLMENSTTAFPDGTPSPGWGFDRAVYINLTVVDSARTTALAASAAGGKQSSFLFPAYGYSDRYKRWSPSWAGFTFPATIETSVGPFEGADCSAAVCVRVDNDVLGAFMGTAIQWRAVGAAGLGCGASPGVASTAFDASLRSAYSFIDIAVGPAHACLISERLKLHCFGENVDGRSGVRTFVQPSGVWDGPPASQDSSDVRSVAAGTCHTLAVTGSGGGLAFGCNDYKQLGDGTGAAWAAPQTIRPTLPLRMVSGGFTHSLAIATDGTLLAFGDNGNGALGTATAVGINSYNLAPERVLNLPAGRVRDAFAGRTFSFAVMETGELYSWGLYSSQGELGTGTTTGSTTPVRVQGWIGSNAVAVTGTHAGGCARGSNSSLWCWGGVYNGLSLGDGTSSASTIPKLVSGWAGSNTLAVAAGNFHVIVLATNGSLWGFGYLCGGTCASDSTVPVAVPTPFDAGDVVAKVAAGGFQTCILSMRGAAACVDTATRSYKLLARGRSSGSVFLSLSLPTTGSVCAATLDHVAAGRSFTCVANKCGVYCSGAGGSGQLGNGGIASTSAMAPVSGLPATQFLSIAAGEFAAYAVTSSNQWYAWGSGGLLGDGTSADRSSAGLVSGWIGTHAIRVAAGSYYACAIATNRTVWCTANAAGAFAGLLGNGDTSARSVPVQVTGLTNVTKLAAGTDSVCAIAGTSLYCWGSNSFGKLADGTQSQRHVPTLVAGPDAHNILDVACGDLHVCAVTLDHRILCSGDGTSGQLGTPYTMSTSTLVPSWSGSPISSDALAIGAGSRHTCVIRTSGGVGCFGYNFRGQLGPTLTPNTNPMYFPIDVPGWAPGAARAISLGDLHSCVLTSAGTAVCWGSNEFGQRADESPTNSGALSTISLQLNLPITISNPDVTHIDFPLDTLLTVTLKINIAKTAVRLLMVGADPVYSTFTPALPGSAVAQGTCGGTFGTWGGSIPACRAEAAAMLGPLASLPAPFATSVSCPNWAMSPAGGTDIIITGELAWIAALEVPDVLVGGTACLSTRFSDSSTLQCAAPAGECSSLLRFSCTR